MQITRFEITAEYLRLLVAGVAVLGSLLFSTEFMLAQDAHFHNAPPSSRELQNPYVNQADAVRAGKNLYTANCGSCHGVGGRGTGNIPALNQGSTQKASDGEVFWFITAGSVNNGMPSWEKLPDRQRWQIVAYLRTLKNVSAAGEPSPAAPPTSTRTNAPAPPAPFTDFRYEEPGKSRKITANDLPAPYTTQSADNGLSMVRRPSDAWPKAPAGFSSALRLRTRQSAPPQDCPQR